MSDERLHALDAVRAFALLLGIVLHTAASFVPSEFGLHWITQDRSTGYLPAVLMLVIHLFRMTLFFFVAGFFAHLLYHRRGAREFASNRIVRIAIPLIVAWTLHTPIHRYLSWLGSARAGKSYELTWWPSAQQWSTGDITMSHLWFLYYLLWFYVVIVGMRHLAVDKLDSHGQLRRRLDRTYRTLVAGRWLPVVLAIPLALAAFFSTEWNPAMGMPNPPSSLMPDPVMLLGYGIAFIAGWVCHRDPTLLQLFAQRSQSLRWIFAAAFVLAGFSSGMVMLKPAIAPTAFRMLAAFAVTVETWCVIFIILGVALRRFADPSPRARYLSDASYWMYIAHIVVVGALQLWMNDWPLHWSIKFPLIVAVASAVLLLSYRYFVRYTLIGTVLNGPREKTELSGLSRAPS